VGVGTSERNSERNHRQPKNKAAAASSSVRVVFEARASDRSSWRVHKRRFLIVVAVFAFQEARRSLRRRRGGCAG